MPRQTKPKRIGVFIIGEQHLKAIRDKVSGILRYSGARPDWEVRLFNRAPAPTDKADNRLDGAIVSCSIPTPLSKLARSHVRLDDPRAPAGSVNIDDREIGRTAAEFLLKRGHTSLAFVGTNRPGLNRHARLRMDEFVRCAKASEATSFTHEIDELKPENWTDELERLATFIRTLPKPCGLMACADEIAKDVLDASRLAHVTVPDQLAIVGVDNELEICENLQPTLTSICPDFERCGFVAARLLDQAMRDGRRHPAGKYVYGVKSLVERASTVDLKGGGRLVAAAGELIRTRALKGITVLEIAKELNCSPRLLEIRFQEIVGRSAKSEILRIRLNEVKRLLKETDRSIDDIAIRCGWRTTVALQTLFKRRFGKSMRAWRANG